MKILFLILLLCCSCSVKEENVVEENIVTKKTYDVDANLSSEAMVYTLINDINENPEDYLGKTLRMKGVYRYYYNEYDGKYLSFCIVTDVLGCCQTGVKFTSEELPIDGQEIIVEGIIELEDERIVLMDASWQPV